MSFCIAISECGFDAYAVLQFGMRKSVVQPSLPADSAACPRLAQQRLASPRRILDTEELAEGVELGSNTLQVSPRSPK